MTDRADDGLVRELDIREKLAHIDHMLVDIDRILADRHRIDAERDRKRQEMYFMPWQVTVTTLGAAAALFAAGAAFIKVIGG